MTILESMLSKKHNSIAYHKCWKCVTSHAMQVAHEPGLDNLADGLTKFLARFKFLAFIQWVLYRGKSNSIDENDEWWLFRVKVLYGFFLGPTSCDPKSCAIIIHILLHDIYFIYVALYHCDGNNSVGGLIYVRDEDCVVETRIEV
jgi:hypothetical protein